MSKKNLFVKPPPKSIKLFRTCLDITSSTRQDSFNRSILDSFTKYSNVDSTVLSALKHDHWISQFISLKGGENSLLNNIAKQAKRRLRNRLMFASIQDGLQDRLCIKAQISLSLQRIWVTSFRENDFPNLPKITGMLDQLTGSVANFNLLFILTSFLQVTFLSLAGKRAQSIKHLLNLIFYLARKQLWEHIMICFKSLCRLQRRRGREQQCLILLTKLLKLSWLFQCQQIQFFVYKELSQIYIYLNMPHLSHFFTVIFDTGEPLLSEEGLSLKTLAVKQIQADFSLIREGILPMEQDFDLELLMKTWNKKKYSTEMLQASYQIKLKEYNSLRQQLRKNKKKRLKRKPFEELKYLVRGPVRTFVNNKQMSLLNHQQVQRMNSNKSNVFKIMKSPRPSFQVLRSHESLNKSLQGYYEKEDGQFLNLLNPNKSWKILRFMMSSLMKIVISKQ